METNKSVTLTETQEMIQEVCKDVCKFLLEKNRKYGDSAVNPIRCFSKADSVEQIKVRIDDKINRMMNRQNDDDEDIEEDLLGYLILLKVAKKKLRGNSNEDRSLK